MKKAALLVGCNYPDRPDGWDKLKGSYNDVNAVHETLTNVYGFDRHNIEVLTDETGSSQMPTGKKIKSTLKHLISEIGPGDILFFHFSGHGTDFPYEGKEREEAIVPSDGNFITKMDFRSLVNNLHKGATFVFFADCCHSGGLFDQKKEQIGPNTSSRNGARQLEDCRSIPYETVLVALDETPSSSRGRHNMSKMDIKTVMLDKFGTDASLLFIGTRGRLKPLQSNQGILLSACQSNERAYECTNDKGQWHGVFTLAVQKIIQEKLLSESFNNKQLVMKAREIMPRISKTTPKQHPCLYCSDDNVHWNFLSNAKMSACSMGEGTEDISEADEMNWSLFNTTMVAYAVWLRKSIQKLLISFWSWIILLIQRLHPFHYWSLYGAMVAYAVSTNSFQNSLIFSWQCMFSLIAFAMPWISKQPDPFSELMWSMPSLLHALVIALVLLPSTLRMISMMSMMLSFIPIICFYLPSKSPISFSN